MSENLNMDVLTQMLDKLPGVTYCARMDPTTGKSVWLYLNKRGAELFDVTQEELLADPNLSMARFVPEDRARIERMLAENVKAGAPFVYCGRMKLRDGRSRWIETHATIAQDEGGMLLWYGHTLDVTERKQMEEALHASEAELAASEAAKSQLIDRLRHAIDELSNPILEVWEGVLAMPIIGLVDSRRTADMVQRLLGEVTRMQASFVIIDLTGVDIVDTKTADHLMKLMRKVEVVGARCVLTGIRPAVAETLVDIGVDFGRLSTLRNLKHGLREALRLGRRERDGLRDQDLDEEPAEESQRRRAR